MRGSTCVTRLLTRPAATTSLLDWFPHFGGTSNRGFSSAVAAPVLLRTIISDQTVQRFNASQHHDFSFQRGFAWGGSKPQVVQSEEGGASTQETAATQASSIPGEVSDITPFDPGVVETICAVAESDALQQALAGTWFFNSSFQRLITFGHQATGTEWWLSIAAVTCIVRLCVFPVVVKQVKTTYRMTEARPELVAAQELAKAEIARGNPNAQAEFAQRMSIIWEKYDCHPLKAMMAPLVQLPIFIGFFSALRSLSAAKVPSFTEGGILWFTDLSVPDSTYALPIIASSIFLLTVELGAADGMQGQDPTMMGRMKWFLRVLAVAMVPLTASMPASVFCYWIPSNIVSLVQSLALKTNFVKKALKLPDLTALKQAQAGPPEGMAHVGKPVPLYDYRPPVKRKPLSQNPRQV